ncbi:mitochondrial zinc maintenance protein 1, mitochondrial [Lipomyces doorenjongii]|uniref:mitochondrial zinc maintenance protein 1, mitochondrial n=1 Tax=Lipomyces doorenjongii TaxID=383834 RepID=UPI0034CFAE46
MSRRQQVLSSYRSLLRATRYAFDGDHRVFTAARQQVRQGYETGRHELTSDPKDCDEIDKRLEHASGVALLLRSNIVQGELQPGKAGKENMATVDPGDSIAQSDDGGVYKLRIHKYTELGDNEAVKGGKTSLAGTAKKINWNN